jgi:hypothetical protein
MTEIEVIHKIWLTTNGLPTGNNLCSFSRIRSTWKTHLFSQYGTGTQRHGILYARLYLRMTRDLNGHQLWTSILPEHTTKYIGACLRIFLDESSKLKILAYSIVHFVGLSVTKTLMTPYQLLKSSNAENFCDDSATGSRNNGPRGEGGKWQNKTLLTNGIKIES